MSQEQQNGQESADAEAFYPDRGPNREEMASGYIPKEEEWSAKTVLDISDPAALAALQQFGEMFPEVDDLQPVIDEFLEEFLRSRTSVGGKSRQEIKDIFVSMYGGNPDGNDFGSAFADALAGDLDDD